MAVRSHLYWFGIASRSRSESPLDSTRGDPELVEGSAAEELIERRVVVLQRDAGPWTRDCVGQWFRQRNRLSDGGLHDLAKLRGMRRGQEHSARGGIRLEKRLQAEPRNRAVRIEQIAMTAIHVSD